MFHDASSVRPAAWLYVCALGVATGILTSIAPAHTIDLSLNLLYSDPGSPNSNGTWQIVAKTDSPFGIASLSVRLLGITTAQNNAPRGIVNGTDGAGFWVFDNSAGIAGSRNITVGQAPVSNRQTGEEESLFYGVGTFENGSPRYAGQIAGTNSLPPTFTTLSSVNGVPWANGLPLGVEEWSTAALFASGPFSMGIVPEFFPGSAGNVFTTQGSSTMSGVIMPATGITTTIRSNLQRLLGDYNDNGAVDAADYVLWRKTQGQTGPGLPADGDGDLDVDNDDYVVWRAHFGDTLPGAGAALSASSVPEPAGAVLLVIGAMLAVRSPRSGLRRRTKRK